MTVTALRPTDAPPTLEQLAAEPARVGELALPECTALVVRVAGLLAVLGTRLVETTRTGLQPPLDLQAAAVLLGMHPETLRRQAKTDAAVKACVFDNGTDRLLFDLAKIEAFRRRRTGA